MAINLGLYDRPFGFLLIRISEKHNFFVIREYQAERSLDATQAIVLVNIPVAPSGSPRGRSENVRLVVFNGYGFFESDRGSGLLRDVIESDKIRTNYS